MNHAWVAKLSPVTLMLTPDILLFLDCVENEHDQCRKEILHKVCIQCFRRASRNKTSIWIQNHLRAKRYPSL